MITAAHHTRVKPSQKKKVQKIVVCDKNHKALEYFLRESGFDVVRARSEEEIIKISHTENPSLIIGDFKQSDVNVTTLCRKIKKDYLLRHTPIIIVTSKSEIREKIEAVNGGADDYIIAPFYVEELIARIRRVIYTTENALNANPLTKLPGNITLKHEIEERMHEKKEFAAYYIDLDNFKVFNDCYGYNHGDHAITLTAQILIESLAKNDLKKQEDFVGHIGGDDFVMLSCCEKVEDVCREIMERFDSRILELYSPEDRKRKYVTGLDRKGKTQIYPIMTISIAVTLSQEVRRFEHVAELSKRGAEIKKYLKQFHKSNYMVDRRN